MLVLVLGGARSGKSEVAEALAARLAGNGPVTYVATGWADPDDADMAARIDRHRGRRPASWTTVEAGARLVEGLAGIDEAAPVLIDALGTWLAASPDLTADPAPLAAALATRPGPTVVVSDEVGLGVHPSSEVGRRFRDALGLVNQAVADVADLVLLAVAGRVLELPRPAQLLGRLDVGGPAGGGPGPVRW